MAGSLGRKLGDDGQRERDCVDGCREIPERDPALRRSQQSLRYLSLTSGVISALGCVGDFLVKDSRPAAVSGHPQAVCGFLAYRADKRVCAAPLVLCRRDQLGNPGGPGAEIS
jgi:hypothetical protein